MEGEGLEFQNFQDLFDRKLHGADDVDGMESLPGGAVEDFDQIFPEFPPFFGWKYFEIPKSLIHVQFDHVFAH